MKFNTITDTQIKSDHADVWHLSLIFQSAGRL